MPLIYVRVHGTHDERMRMRPIIDPKRAKQFKEQAQAKKRRLWADGNKTPTRKEKAEIVRLSQIIADCDAVIRGDGKKRGK
jgi:hypothetical protein